MTEPSIRSANSGDSGSGSCSTMLARKYMAVGLGHRPVGRRGRLGLGQRGDRPGLHDEEPSVRSRPLDVLRCAEVVLDPGPSAASAAARRR